MRFPMQLFQFWLAALLAEMVGIGTYLIGFLKSLVSMDLFYSAALYHLFTQKEFLFLILIGIIGIGFFVPFQFLKDLWTYTFQSSTYIHLLKLIGLAFFIHLVHFFLPETWFKFKVLLLFIAAILWIRVIYVQALLFYSSEFHSLHIPTTFSTFFISIALSGMCLISLLQKQGVVEYRFWLVLFLVMDLVVFTGSLKNFKEISPLTTMSLKEIFGKFFILTAIYFVPGIIIPVLYLTADILGIDLNIQFLIPFILGGQITKIFLYFLPSFAMIEGDTDAS
jgi:hypothetical protein